MTLQLKFLFGKKEKRRRKLKRSKSKENEATLQQNNKSLKN